MFLGEKLLPKQNLIDGSEIVGICRPIISFRNSKEILKYPCVFHI